MQTWAPERATWASDTPARRFAQIAEAYPNRTALAYEEETITYAVLDERSNWAACRLLEMGVTSDSLVGICLHRSPEFIVAMLGILKAGAAYVPFDPQYPQERLNLLLADTRVKVIITNHALVSVIDPDALHRHLFIDETLREAKSNAVEMLNCAGPSDMAYIMYTSGSTGRPKGVMIENRSIMRLVAPQEYCSFGPEEVFLQASPCSFDASTFEIWGALLHGATLAIPTLSEARSLSGLPTPYNVTALLLFGLRQGFFIFLLTSTSMASKAFVSYSPAAMSFRLVTSAPRWSAFPI